MSGLENQRNPKMGKTKRILPGLYYIRVPFPESPLAVVNSYVIISKGRALIIDTGFKSDKSLHHMKTALSELGLDAMRCDFFITHWHSDHMGLISDLAMASSKIYLNEAEANGLSGSYQYYWGGRYEEMSGLCRQYGLPEEDIENIRSVIEPGPEAYGIKSDLDFDVVKDGSEIRIGNYGLICVGTPGHSLGHTCLYEPIKKVLFSGDHILPSITPNISIWYNNKNPLNQYLKSLDKTYDLNVQLALPGHGRVLRDLRKRVEEIRRHHEKRIREVMAIMSNGRKTAYEISLGIKWDVSSENWKDFASLQRWFALGETLAHLVFLEEEGKICRSSGSIVQFEMR
jgi:glyoxylase-like metal-dependent hydrolase (beta-lactamase superfamily II)